MLFRHIYHIMSDTKPEAKIVEAIVAPKETSSPSSSSTVVKIVAGVTAVVFAYSLYSRYKRNRRDTLYEYE